MGHVQCSYHLCLPGSEVFLHGAAVVSLAVVIYALGAKPFQRCVGAFA